MVHESQPEEDLSLFDSFKPLAESRASLSQPRVSNHFLVDYDLTGRVKYKVTSVSGLVRKLKWVKLISFVFSAEQEESKLNSLFKTFFGDFKKCLNSEIVE